MIKGELIKYASKARALTATAAEPLTVNELLDRYLLHVAQGTDGLKKVEQNTLEGYELIFNTHIRPTFGEIELAKLTWERIADWLANAKRTVQRRNPETGKVETVTQAYAPKSLRNYGLAFSAALTYAVNKGWITRNPVEGDKLPEIETNKQQVQTASPEEINHILTRLRGRRWYLPSLISFATGMRRAEVLGLRWKHFDAETEDGVLYVIETRTQSVSNAIREKKGTKNGRTRPVYIDAALRDILLQKRAQRNPAPNDLICVDESSEAINPGKLSSAFSIAAKDCGIDLTFHGLRHTHVTMLLKAGVPVIEVADRIGDTIQVVMQTYANYIPGRRAEVARIAGATFILPADAAGAC